MNESASVVGGFDTPEDVNSITIADPRIRLYSVGVPVVSTKVMILVIIGAAQKRVP